MIGGFALALGVTGHAQAAPSPAELEAQIDKAWNDLEPIIEQHNQIKSELAANQTKVDQLTKQIAPLAAQVDVAFGRVSALSVQYFKTGPSGHLTALLSSDRADSLPDQLVLLNELARSEQADIRDVLKLKQQYDTQKAPLDELVKKLSSQEADLAAKEKTINDQIKQLNTLRLQAYGTTGGTGALRPVLCPGVYAGGAAAKAAQVACNQIGKPYVWGSDGPSTFDCSGLTMYAWAQAGVKLRHYTRWQYEDTKRVAQADLRPGDLIFFYGDMHHVGMYVGNGWMVHAPHSGDVVRMAEVAGRPISGYGRPG